MASSEPSTPGLRPAALIYAPGGSPGALLARFARDLQGRGWQVGGLVQEIHRNAEGYKQEIIGVELDTGRRLRLAQYRGDRRQETECGFDDGALAEATGAVRRAVAEKADIILIEKFSRREREGQGLFDEILSAMAEGIPTVTAVAGTAVEEWTRFTGGLSVLLPPDLAALWRWWGPHRLYQDLVLGVGDGTARRVVLGFNWVLVEGPEGCGLAQTPSRGAAGCRDIPDADGLAGRPLAELARRVHSWNPVEAAIGLAALNAHYNRHDLQADPGNGLDAFAREPGPITIVGRFPGLAKRFADVRVIEREPGENEFPATAADWLLPGSERTVVTASALIDHSLPGLLAARREGDVALVGPSTPLTPRLHDYGIDLLAGMIIEDVEGAARAAAEGGAVAALKPHARMVTLTAS